jgi:dTDP-L-rhamnose 4-epimerase
MRILITGGAGFIGSNLALELKGRGHEVTVLDNLSEQIHGADPEEKSSLYASIRNRVHFIRGTVTQESDWIKAIEGMDAIVHFAAETGTGQSMYQISRYTEVNIGGTALMLDVLSRIPHKVKKIVVASSRAIYGEGKYLTSEGVSVYPECRSAISMSEGDFEVSMNDVTGPLKLVATDEASKIHPTSVYGITKQVQEQLVMTVCPSLGIAPVGFRYQNVYGPGQSLKNPYTGILSIFSTQIKNGQSINIFEDGEESRDFVFIDDVVSATVAGIENSNANGEVFNVGTGKATSVKEVARQLIHSYGIEVPVTITGNFRVGDIRHNYADIKKAQALLGFTPKVDFGEGIRRFTEWVNTQEIGVSRYEQSLQEMRAKGLMK